jgi:haloalkane dehalogenase
MRVPTQTTHTKRSAAGQLHTTIKGAGHFLQEDKGEELTHVIADFVAATPQ